MHKLQANIEHPRVLSTENDAPAMIHGVLGMSVNYYHTCMQEGKVGKGRHGIINRSLQHSYIH